MTTPWSQWPIVPTALSCPSSFKVHRGLRKRLLVDAYRGRLPDEILDRAKMGFEVPIAEFLRSSLRDLFLDTVTRERVESLEVLDYAGLGEERYREVQTYSTGMRQKQKLAQAIVHDPRLVFLVGFLGWYVVRTLSL